MDLKGYFKKVRELENTLGATDVLITSLETPDGGKAGVMTEVPSRIASQMILDGRARVATDAEESSFRVKQQAEINAAKEAVLAQRIQVQLVTNQSERTELSKRKS